MEKRERSQIVLPILMCLLSIATGLTVALLPINPSVYIGIGFLLGALFGQSVLLSAWIVFGPGGWLRIVFALAWAAIIPIALVTNHALYRLPSPTVLWASEFATILLVQILGWPTWYIFKARVFRDSDLASDAGMQQGLMQFGIFHLIVATTAVAFVLGLGRLLLPGIRSALGDNELPVFIFLMVVTLVMCLPLMLAVLAMKRPLLPTLLLLALVGLGTYYEIDLMSRFGLTGPKWQHLMYINLFTVAQVLAVTVAVRVNGYRLVAIHPAGARSGESSPLA